MLSQAQVPHDLKKDKEINGGCKRWSIEVHVGLLNLNLIECCNVYFADMNKR